MTADEAIKLAIDTIGEGKQDDYIISPTKHADEFKQKAPDLAAILSSGAVLATARQFENDDRDALTAQEKFKRVFNRANVTVLITGILIALVLAIGTVATLLGDSLERFLLIALSLGSVITGALAYKDLSTIKEGHLLENWMSKKRAFAEMARLAYFNAVAKASVATPAMNGGLVELLKLEYFRRFQLDIQQAFYRERGRHHAEEAEKTLSYSSWAIAGAAIATGAAGVLGVIDAKFAAIAALGTIFTSLSSFAALREAVYQNRRNAERYESTSRVLVDLSKRLDEVRQAVYTAGTKPLMDFIEAVHEQLSLEHKQWLGELGEAQGAFATLENTLKEVSSRISKEPTKLSSN